MSCCAGGDHDHEVHIDEAVLRELQLCDAQLTDVATEAAAKEYLMARDLLSKRQATIAKIPNFWGVVFDAAYTELEAAVTPADRKLLGAVSSIDIIRPEIPASAKPSDSGLEHFGEPRSIAIRFTFNENEFIADSALEKVFYYRYGKDGFAGLVSEPIKIQWKAGKDLTQGLTDAAYKLWSAQKAAGTLDGVFDKEARQKRDKAATQMAEYKALAKLLEENEDGAVSFFNFFSYRGRWTSAEESAEARKESRERRQKALAGQPVEEDEDNDEDDEEEFPEGPVETFSNGGEVAAALADDIWPNAIDYFLAPTIDSDFETDDEDDDDEDDDDDVEMS